MDCSTDLARYCFFLQHDIGYIVHPCRVGDEELLSVLGYAVRTRKAVTGLQRIT